MMDPELKRDLEELKKSLHSNNLSSRNRVLSIVKDSNYVNNVKEKYYPEIPIIPNDRCGRWYVDPKYYEQELTPSYFKSTDGHTNNWSFSTRRLNLHLLSQVRERNGIIIVDSTRRGKKIPDSFSKTVPIWISIINKFLFPNVSFDDLLFTPEETVSEYEHSRILRLLPDFYQSFVKFQDLIKGRILANVEMSEKRKMLKPFWIYPGCKEYPIFDGCEEYLPIILLSASEQSQDGENKMYGYTYVQGAGDDHELWSRGLNPQIFWSKYQEMTEFIHIDDHQADETIDKFVSASKQNQNVPPTGTSSEFWRSEDITKVTELLYFGKIDENLSFKESEIDNKFSFDKVVVLDTSFKHQADHEKQQKVFAFGLDSGSKKSSKQLRGVLPSIMEVLKSRSDPCKTLIVCNSGEDLSVAIVICYLNHLSGMDKRTITKETIRRDLIRLLELRKVNPQRATLNAVNSYLMS